MIAITQINIFTFKCIMLPFYRGTYSDILLSSESSNFQRKSQLHLSNFSKAFALLNEIHFKFYASYCHQLTYHQYSLVEHQPEFLILIGIACLRSFNLIYNVRSFPKVHTYGTKVFYFIWSLFPFSSMNNNKCDVPWHSLKSVICFNNLLHI